MAKLSQNNIRYLLAAIAGSSLTLIFAPFYLFFVGFISVSTLFLLINEEISYKKSFFYGLIYGFGFFLSANYWIAISLLVDAKSHAWLIPFALTLIPLALATYIALTCLSYKFCVKLLNIKKNYEKILIFATFWLFFEFLRSILFSGFPWNLIGYSWLFSIKMSQLVSIIGIFGLSFFAILIFLIPSLFVQIKQNKIEFIKFSQVKIADKILTLAVIICLISSFIFGHFRLNNENIISQKNYKIRLVQANITQNLKWNPDEKYQNLLKHIKLSNNESLDDIDMVVWSEASIPYLVSNDKSLIEFLSQAIPIDGILVSGALRSDGKKFWNSVFALSKNGIEDHYDKHHLVPFGEYVPLQEYLPFIQKITKGASGFAQGSGPKTLTANNISFSPLICYEAIFSQYSLNNNNKKPDLLINVTNDSWFGNSIGPHQHLAMAQMRSIETSLPMARVANSGITAFIDSFGRIKKKIDLNEVGVIDVELAGN